MVCSVISNEVGDDGGDGLDADTIESDAGATTRVTVLFTSVYIDRAVLDAGRGRWNVILLYNRSIQGTRLFFCARW